MTYQESINNKNKDTKRRKRKIIWFNPTYSKNVSTKVGNQFLKLINKHFPRHHKFHKLFNKNNVKISYSCMPNMKNIIRITKKIINPQKDNIARTYNCIRKHQCPLNEKCLTNNVLYQASITTNEENQKKNYYGVPERLGYQLMIFILKIIRIWLQLKLCWVLLSIKHSIKGFVAITRLN